MNDTIIETVILNYYRIMYYYLFDQYLRSYHDFYFEFTTNS
jgi:hypothetical protein